MMKWRREFDFPFETILYIVAAFLVIVSLYSGSLLLSFLALFFCCVNLASHYYFKYIAERIELANPQQSIRLFVDDEDMFSIRVANVGILPLLYGEFRFTLDNSADCIGLKQKFTEQKQNTYTFSFSLGGQSVRQMNICVKGLKRGVARFRGVHLTVHDGFGMAKMHLTYDSLLRTEIIVYPELIPVYGLEHIQTTWQGTRPVQYSLDEDATSPTGTRNYLPSDPFHHIHWKASAKAGNLQTKTFEKTSGMTWVLLLNITKNGIYSADLEREISCMAYICKFAVEHGIPFELYMNVKTRGRGEIMHIYAGEGREQLSKALELLTRVNVNSVTVSTDWLLSYVDRQRYQYPMMILCHLSYKDDGKGILQKWKSKGYGIYSVEHREDGMYVLNIANRKAVS